MPSTVAALPANRVKRTQVSQYKDFKRLKALSCFDRVDQLIKSGMPATTIAEMIQERWFEVIDWSRAGLEKALCDYRRSLPDEVLFGAVLSQDHVEAVKRQLGEIDALEEMGWLWVEQKRRLQLDFKSEEHIGKLFKFTHREVGTGLDILKEIAKLRQDLGIDKRHLGELEITTGLGTEEVKSQYGESIAEVMEDPKKCQRVLSAADDILGLLQRVAADATDNPPIDVTPDSDPDPDAAVPDSPEAGDGSGQA